MAKPKAPQDRYTVVDGVKREFGSIKKDELYELYESDNTQVGGKFIAISDAYLNDDKIWCIDSLPYMELKLHEERVRNAEVEAERIAERLKDAKAVLKAFKEKKHV